MSKIGHGRDPGYIPGDNWDTCDRCDFEYRVSELQEEWNGLTVCDECYEPRHPQDFLRVKEEQIKADQVGTASSTDNTVEVTFAESFTVPSGTFNNEL